jgi:hypothetical protein
MAKIGEHVKCPECGRESRIVWVSQDGKLAAIKCTNYHSQISPPPTKWTLNAETKMKKGIVFLTNII